MTSETGTRGPGSGGGARPTKYPIWLGLLALGIGLACFLGAFLFARSELRYGAEGLAAQATILRLWVDEGENSDGDTTYSYHAGYEFADSATGSRFNGSGEVGELRYFGLHVGDAIQVSFLSSDPSENRLGTPEPRLLLPALIGLVGGLAVVVAPLVVASTIRERRARRISSTLPPGASGDVRRIDVFTRSPISAAGGPLALGFGIAFLVLAMFGITQAANMPSLLMLTLFGSVIGLGLIAGGITALRRGFGLKLAEVGPDGLWLLGLGRLAWTELAEVRIEEPNRSGRSGDGSAQGGTRSTSTRLGVVPRDPALLARRPDRLGRALGRTFFGFLNVMQSETRLVTESDQSPYGIAVSELDQSFDALLASVGRFASIGSRAVLPMGGPAEPADSPPLPSETAPPMTDAELREADARLGWPGRGSDLVDDD